jgi:hypothetical protein
MPVLHLRLDPHTYGRLERIAQREHRTEGAQVLHVLERWLRRAHDAPAAPAPDEAEGERRRAPNAGAA